MKFLYLLTLFLFVPAGTGEPVSFMKLFTMYAKFFRDGAVNIINKSGVKSECAEDLRLLLTEMLTGKKWSLEMLDSTAKFQAGLLNGNLYQVGSYDECLNINNHVQDPSRHVVRGQYCTVLLFPKFNSTSELHFLLDTNSLTDWNGISKNYHFSDLLSMFKLTYGICLPRTCSIENLQSIWDYVENFMSLSVHMHFYDIMCSHTDKPVEEYDVDIYVFLFFGAVFTFITSCTLYDCLIYQHQREKEENLWISFSAYSNMKLLVTLEKAKEQTDEVKVKKNKTEKPDKREVPPEKSDDVNLSCIGGIRTISMLWIALGHRYVLNFFTPSINTIYLFEWKKKSSSVFSLSTSLAVDTFFTLSGFLLSYLFFKSKLTHKVNLLQLYGTRIMRLVPGLLAMILINMSVLKYLGDGPLWPLIHAKIAGSCYHTWWATLLFFSNFAKLSNQCVEQAWYLSIDTQLYAISPLFLFFFTRHPKKVLFAIGTLVTASVIYTFYLTVANELGAIYLEANQVYMEKMYLNSFVRLTPWAIGLCFGYFLFMKPNVKLSKITVMFLWCLSVGTLYFICWCHLLFTRNDFDVIRSAIYNAFARLSWGIAICITIFLCGTGYGGIINKFLSIGIFKILSRLSYSVFLAHFGVQFILIGRQRVVTHFSDVKTLHDFCGDFIAIMIASLLLHLTFEAPFVQFARNLAKRKRSVNKSTNTNNQLALQGGYINSSANYLICIFSFMGTNKKKNEIKHKIK